MAKIEFYVGDADKHIDVVEDGAIPREGEDINIRRVPYVVERVTWAIDGPEVFRQRTLRANVQLRAKE